jgi:hypothetical protein
MNAELSGRHHGSRARTLLQVRDEDTTSRTGRLFTVLMGENVELRRTFIEETHSTCATSTFEVDSKAYRTIWSRTTGASVSSTSEAPRG